MSICEFLREMLGVNYDYRVEGRDRCVFVFRGGALPILDIDELGRGKVRISVRGRYRFLEINEPIVVVSDDSVSPSDVRSWSVIEDTLVRSRGVEARGEVIVVTRGRGGKLTLYFSNRK